MDGRKRQIWIKLMFLTKLNTGDYRPTYSSDLDESAKVKVGEEIRGTRARNVKHHRKCFALIKLGFDNQDKFTDISIYRMVLTIKAGFVVWVDGKDKKKYPLPESISFESMSQRRFDEFYSAILTVIMAETKLTDKEIEQELINFM